MKRLIFAIIAVLAISMFTSCERVAPNYQGVLMEHYGKNGKGDFTLQKGRVWTAAPGTELFQVPLWEQRGDFGDRVLHLKAADNTEFTSKPLYSYKVMENRAIDVVFDNKQIGSGESGEEFMNALEENILNPRIYDLMKEESRRHTTEALMADGGSLEYENIIQEIIRKEFETRGLLLVSFSSPIDFTDKVKEKIDVRNEVNTNISVIDQQIAEQKKRNELAQLQTDYNLIISRGLTPQILEKMKIEKWDGQLPAGTTNPVGVLVSK